MTIPRKMTAMVIGKGGGVIQNLQRQSKVRIVIMYPKETINMDNRLFIWGDPMNCQVRTALLHSDRAFLYTHIYSKTLQ